MRSARARPSRDAARSGTGGGAWGVFPALAADVETAWRVTGRDRGPGGRAKPNILDRVFRRDAFSMIHHRDFHLAPSLPVIYTDSLAECIETAKQGQRKQSGEHVRRIG